MTNNDDGIAVSADLPEGVTVSYSDVSPDSVASPTGEEGRRVIMVGAGTASDRIQQALRAEGMKVVSLLDPIRITGGLSRAMAECASASALVSEFCEPAAVVQQNEAWSLRADRRRFQQQQRAKIKQAEQRMKRK